MRILSVVLLCFNAAIAKGQFDLEFEPANPEPSLHMEVYFDWSIPLGDFSRNITEQGLGIGGEMLYNVSGPAWLGAGFHTFRYDNLRITYVDFFGSEAVELDEITASRSTMAHLLMRFEPLTWKIFKPYLQAGIGWHWFFTNTKITDIEFDEEIERFNEQRDSRLGYSLQFGTLLFHPQFSNIGLDLRVGYTSNASVEYFNLSEQPTGPSGFPIDQFEASESVIDMLAINIGAYIRF